MGKAPKSGSNPLMLILAILVSLLSCDNTDFDRVVLDSINCVSGDIDIDEKDLHLVINGKGFAGIELDCIRAEGDCDVDIEAEDIRLINCRECIRVGGRGTAEVTLTALEDIECDAIGDGVSARDNAVIDLNAIENIAIFSIEGSGIRAEGMSTVELDTVTGTCFIDGPAGDIVQDDTAVVDTDGCNEVDFVEDVN